MALIRRSPWHDLYGMQREMDDFMRRMVGAFDRPWMGAASTPTRSTWVPAVDVFSREGDLVVRAELPGINPDEDVDISVQEGVLHIRGERRQEEQWNGDDAFRIESSYGAFERSVLLPDGVDPDDIAATYENGILEVVVPKAGELAGARKIPVQAGEGKRRALTARGRDKS